MADDSDPRRDALHEFLQEQGPPPPDADDPDRTIADGAVLTGWVLIAEWMDPEGERWLVRGHAAGKTRWEAVGMAHEFLYGDW